MRRRIFTEDHEAFRMVVRSFFAHEMKNNLARWLSDGRVDRDLFVRAGSIGLFGLRVPEAFGGAGMDTFTFNVVVSEAAAAERFSAVGFRIHADVVLPYFLRYGTQEQQERFVPPMVQGSSIGAIAMSEPKVGSDLAGIGTVARLDGNAYVINGSKTFITNGANADTIIVVARTGHDEADRRRGLTLLVVEGNASGLSRSKPLKKLGLPYSDTCELFFDDVRVPVDNRLGEEGSAFEYLVSNLALERVGIAVGAVAMSRVALNDAIQYSKDREMFGTRLASFQNTKFVLAEIATEIEAAEQFLDSAVLELDAGELSVADAARLKLFCTEVQSRAVDKALQVHGGYGYMSEYPISSMYADARVTRLYGGSSEVMKVVISRSLGL